MSAPRDSIPEEVWARQTVEEKRGSDFSNFVDSSALSTGVRPTDGRYALPIPPPPPPQMRICPIPISRLGVSEAVFSPVGSMPSPVNMQPPSAIEVLRAEEVHQYASNVGTNVLRNCQMPAVHNLTQCATNQNQTLVLDSTANFSLPKAERPPIRHTEERSERTTNTRKINGTSEGEQEYVIDGETPIDDVLFASLYAQMDNAVLHELESVPAPSCVPLPNRRDSGTSSNSDDLSECESQADLDVSRFASKDICLMPRPSLCVLGVREVVNEDSDEDGEITTANVLGTLGISEAMLTKSLDSASSLGPAARMTPLGTVLHQVEELITLRASTHYKIFEVGTACYRSDRNLCGVVVDTFGPTTDPFYVVYAVTGFVAETQQILFIDTTQSNLAEVDHEAANDEEHT